MNVDLLLVNPSNRLEQFANLNELATVAQPLGIAMIASYVRQFGYSVAIIDAEAEFWTVERTVQEIEKYNPRFVGLTAFTTKMTVAGEILKLVKQKMPDVKTILGGHHPSAIPERTLREEAIDYVIKGEGFYPALHLVEGWVNVTGAWYLVGNTLIDNGRAKGIQDLDTLPLAAWDLLPMKKYRAHHWQLWDYNLKQSGFALIYTSLGCPFDCDYCTVNVVYGEHKTRYRSASHVVDEIELLVKDYGVRDIEIIDDTFTANYKRVEAFCDEIISRKLGDKLNMWCFARADKVTPYLMEKMKRAGINWVFMGFESGDDIVLQGVHKKQTVEQIKKSVDIVHNAGIHVGGNYIFGLPQDTQKTMQQTLDLAKELNTEYANFFVMMAYPGTKLYEIALEKGHPMPRKWGQYGFFASDAVPLSNENLTSWAILNFRDFAFKEYFNGERYQGMIREKFGQNVVDFLNQKVLSKNIVRAK